MSKMSSNLLDVLKMENSILNGLPFWGLDVAEEINSEVEEKGLSAIHS